MNSKISNSKPLTHVSEGILSAHSNKEGGEYKRAEVAGIEIRVWGAEGSKLSAELVAGLRQIVREFRPTHPIALMADHHRAEFGIVGSVVASAEKMYPDLIGGDCGCGVYAACISVAGVPRLRKNLESVYRIIMERIPVGTAQHADVSEGVHELPFWKALENTPAVHSRDIRRLRHQFGTLGGGNHFIELASDSIGRLWVLVHSGSRFLGGLLKQYYAKNMMLLESDEARAFFMLQDAALKYAAESRKHMARSVLEALRLVYADEDFSLREERDLTHNFIALEVHERTKLAVHRKGACRAEANEKGVIPGSMADGSLLVTGRGAAWSYASSSHGSGRKLSRGAAFRELSTTQFFSEMKNIVWGESERLKDEAPAAYKDLRKVATAQRDLVRIEAELLPILSVKGVK